MAAMMLFHLLVSFALAHSPLSAVRDPQKDYRTYLRHTISRGASTGETVLDRAEDLNTNPWLKLRPTNYNQNKLQLLFNHLRDHRPTTDKENRSRRLPWLYPDDGCYAKSAMMQSRIKAGGQEGFHQIFLFGNLFAATPNHPAKQVSWWYHVAPIVRTTEGVFVLDPTLDPLQPLKVEHWISRMIHFTQEAKVSLCEPASFTPESECFSKGPIDVPGATEEIREVYFDLEWERIHHLGRNPEQELGPLRAKSHSNFFNSRTITKESL
ncbi:MAG: hypothetical protein RJB66_1939 [Pseudomonadota bacterium]|jgi:hypothetical protein